MINYYYNSFMKITVCSTSMTVLKKSGYVQFSRFILKFFKASSPRYECFSCFNHRFKFIVSRNILVISITIDTHFSYP